MHYRVGVWLAALLVASSLVIGSTSPVLAASTRSSTRDLFPQQNDVLYYEKGCAETTGSSGSGSATTTSSSGGGGGCGGTAEENKKQIWSFLKSKGLSDDAAAGIMGNMEQESGFMPTADNNKTMGFVDSTGHGCRGIVQWCHERNSGLDEFAAGRGTRWDCLGTQLEYMWYEMTETDQGRYNGNGEHLEIPLADALNGQSFSRSSNYNRSGAYNAAAIFHDYFERANTAKGENLGRGERGEEIYKEFTGKTADTSLLGNSSSGNICTAGSAIGTAGVIPSEECAALIEQYKQLVSSGKITYYGDGATGTYNRSIIEQDIENCTTNQISCGEPGIKGTGGVNPRILRAVVAGAANSGTSTVTQWNFNTGHGCDGLNHPRGMASDLYCKGNDQATGEGATDDCDKLFIYYYDHYEELGLTELIWQYPPKGYSCSDPKIICNVSGHTDHIHIGARVKDDANL